jgi:hypothetical protein
MMVHLSLPDGRTIQGVRHDHENWLLVNGPIRTGQRFTLDGIERTVAAVIGIPPSTTAVQFLPDFDRWECAPCRDMAALPAADDCLSRTGCPFRRILPSH